VTDLMTKLIF